ncbi:twin-arginine translocation signal domain-containing protein [Aeromonas simiae]|nr:twin-arginine translocation signal domain-containing protein [Aeromonas simiae]MDO2951051.1 twin-arginine translocation signal domain-containing protein [Aeromonas simiae]
MMSDEKLENPSRRHLLKGAGMAVVAGAVVGVAGQAVAAQDDANKEHGNGYRESDHVKAYYRSLRGTE